MRIICVSFRLKEKLRDSRKVLEFSQEPRSIGSGKAVEAAADPSSLNLYFKQMQLGAVHGIWGKQQRENVVIYWPRGRSPVWNYEISKMEARHRKGRAVFQESI